METLHYSVNIVPSERNTGVAAVCARVCVCMAVRSYHRRVCYTERGEVLVVVVVVVVAGGGRRSSRVPVTALTKRPAILLAHGASKISPTWQRQRRW